LIANTRGGESAQAGVLGTADAVPDGGVRAVPGLQRAQLPDRCVGGEGLKPPAIDVGEPELGARVRPFPAHDHPHPRWPASRFRVGQQPGQLGHMGALARAAVGLDRRRPRRLGQRQDRRLHLADGTFVRATAARCGSHRSKGSPTTATVGSAMEGYAASSVTVVVEAERQTDIDLTLEPAG
jgi:hypothetical protein